MGILRIIGNVVLSILSSILANKIESLIGKIADYRKKRAHPTKEEALNSTQEVQMHLFFICIHSNKSYVCVSNVFFCTKIGQTTNK